jgi:hypothetical protein
VLQSIVVAKFPTERKKKKKKKKSLFFGSALDPEWKFSMEFFYETRYANKLDKKIFKIDCFDYDRVGANDFIGGAQVDLYTLATGPIAHDLVMRDGGKPCGRLQFCCEFEMYSEVEVTLKSINVSSLVAPEPGKPCDPHMQFYFSAVDATEEAPQEGSSPFPQRAKVENKTYRTPQLNDTLAPSWAECEQMWFQATLRELMAESIVVKINQSKKIRGSTMIGGCELALRKYMHPSTDRKLIKFREVLRGPDGSANVGVIEGVVIFTNVPSMAQLKGGLHTDAGVEGGEALLSGLPMPNNIVGGVLNAADIAKVVHGAVGAAAPITALPPSPNNDAAAPDAFLMANAAHVFAKQGGVALAPTGGRRDSDMAAAEHVAALLDSSSGQVGDLSRAPSYPAIHVSSAESKRAAAEHHVPADEPLPKGWEKCHTEKGRVYYVCHQLKRTQWTPPTAAQVAESEAALATKALDAANALGVPPTGVAAHALGVPSTAGAAHAVPAAAAESKSPRLHRTTASPMLPTRRDHLKTTIANRQNGMPRVAYDADNNALDNYDDDEDPTVQPPAPIGVLQAKPAPAIVQDAEDDEDVQPPGPIGAVSRGGAPQADAEDDDNVQPPPAVGMVTHSHQEHHQQQSYYQPQQQQQQPQQQTYGGGYGQPQLPPGWEARMHESGRPFYVDHNTRQTHWSLPTNVWQPQQFSGTGGYPAPGG